MSDQTNNLDLSEALLPPEMVKINQLAHFLIDEIEKDDLDPVEAMEIFAYMKSTMRLTKKQMDFMTKVGQLIDQNQLGGTFGYLLIKIVLDSMLAATEELMKEKAKNNGS